MSDADWVITQTETDTPSFDRGTSAPPWDVTVRQVTGRSLPSRKRLGQTGQMDGQFPNTRWSLVLAAGGSGPSVRPALGELIRMYRGALCTVVRSHWPWVGSDMEDVTQEFLTSIIERPQDLSRIDRTRVHFRYWLLAALKNFLLNEKKRRHALKNGGGIPHLPLEGPGSPSSGLPAEKGDPEKQYTRSWMVALTKHALDQLRAEQTDGSEAKDRRFEAVKEALGAGTMDEEGCRSLAAQAGISEADALRQAVFRLRKLLRSQVADTLAPGGDVDTEIKALLRSGR